MVEVKEFKFSPKSSAADIEKVRQNFKEWIQSNKHRYHMEEVFINNGFAVEYKPLYKIKFNAR